VAYDEALAIRIRSLVGASPGVTERKMFGGIAFMVNGNMFAGIIRDDLMARVGKSNYDSALQRPGTRLMDFAGRPMTGMVFVEPGAIESDKELSRWLDECLRYALALKAK
jgi:TfoX/Sxy family transcriptional regulator of competence genes